MYFPELIFRLAGNLVISGIGAVDQKLKGIYNPETRRQFYILEADQNSHLRKNQSY